MTQEKATQSKLLNFLNSKENNPHIYAIKTITTNVGGVPDVIACILGHFVAFECKAVGIKPTLLQTFNLEKINRARGTSFVVTKDNLEMVKNSVRLFLIAHKTKTGIKI